MAPDWQPDLERLLDEHQSMVFSLALRMTGDRVSPVGTRLEHLLTTLPEAQRAALILRYQEDMLPDEIAAALDAPVATVKSHLQRGLKLLRAKATSNLREFIRGA